MAIGAEDALGRESRNYTVAQNSLGGECRKDTCFLDNQADAGSGENIETSPMFLWDYEGYIDEAKGYTWYNEFVNCDYDKVGSTDRVYRIYDANAQEAYYSIEFGNGRVLSVPKVYDTGFPHVQTLSHLVICGFSTMTLSMIFMTK